GEDDAASAVHEATEFGVRRFTARGMRNGGLLVVGDAAHEVSPIGGQGMNLGLLDAAGLAPLLVRWVRTGEAPDAELARWERMRITSARRAARLAAVNTALGRPAGTLTDAGRRAAIGAALATPSARALAWLYTMGLDRAA
ncbi:MAG: FAD-dependent monooxygenase, partial [Propionibacteriaceae bacterium]|nr:FAD-dependent monooxygenase [Propionibacteriaceae bacterium]